MQCAFSCETLCSWAVWRSRTCCIRLAGLVKGEDLYTEM